MTHLSSSHQDSGTITWHPNPKELPYLPKYSIQTYKYYFRTCLLTFLGEKDNMGFMSNIHEGARPHVTILHGGGPLRTPDEVRQKLPRKGKYASGRLPDGRRIVATAPFEKNIQLILESQYPGIQLNEFGEIQTRLGPNYSETHITLRTHDQPGNKKEAADIIRAGLHELRDKHIVLTEQPIPEERIMTYERPEVPDDMSISQLINKLPQRRRAAWISR